MPLPPPRSDAKPGTWNAELREVLTVVMRISLLFLALAACSAEAQRRPPAAYFQLGGEGLGYSANLDVAVTQSVRLRGGAGFLWVIGTVPVSASYLLTGRNSTFEIGGGATIMVFLEDTNKDDNGLTHAIEKVIFLEGQGTKVLPMGIFGGLSLGLTL